MGGSRAERLHYAQSNASEGLEALRTADQEIGATILCGLVRNLRWSEDAAKSYWPRGPSSAPVRVATRST